MIINSLDHTTLYNDHTTLEYCNDHKLKIATNDNNCGNVVEIRQNTE